MKKLILREVLYSLCADLFEGNHDQCRSKKYNINIINQNQSTSIKIIFTYFHCFSWPKLECRTCRTHLGQPRMALLYVLGGFNLMSLLLLALAKLSWIPRKAFQKHSAYYKSYEQILWEKKAESKKYLLVQEFLLFNRSYIIEREMHKRATTTMNMFMQNVTVKTICVFEFGYVFSSVGIHTLRTTIESLRNPSAAESQLCRMLFASMAGALMMTMRVMKLRFMRNNLGSLKA